MLVTIIGAFVKFDCEKWKLLPLLSYIFSTNQNLATHYLQQTKVLDGITVVCYKVTKLSILDSEYWKQGLYARIFQKIVSEKVLKSTIISFSMILFWLKVCLK
jgi:hypothetical protein